MGVYLSSPGETETQRELFQLGRYDYNKKPDLLPAAPPARPETANQIKTRMMQTKTGSTLRFGRGEQEGEYKPYNMSGVSYLEWHSSQWFWIVFSNVFLCVLENKESFYEQSKRNCWAE